MHRFRIIYLLYISFLFCVACTADQNTERQRYIDVVMNEYDRNGQQLFRKIARQRIRLKEDSLIIRHHLDSMQNVLSQETKSFNHQFVEFRLSLTNLDSSNFFPKKSIEQWFYHSQRQLELKGMKVELLKFSSNQNLEYLYVSPQLGLVASCLAFRKRYSFLEETSDLKYLELLGPLQDSLLQDSLFFY